MTAAAGPLARLGKFAMSGLGKVAPFAIFVAVVVISANWSNWWWYLSIGRSLSPANHLLAEDHPEQAIPLMREVLARHPQDARLYYLLGGAYMANGEEFPALACLKLFRKHAPGDSSDDRERIDLADRAIRELTTYSQYDSSGSAKNYANDGSSLLSASIGLHNKSELAGWRTQIKNYAVQDILAESAVAPPGNASGLINPARFQDAGLFHITTIPFRETIKTASLRQMILDNAFSIDAGDIGPGCCRVPFADPDLRQTPYVLKEGLDRMADLNDAERLNRSLNLKSRLGLKRRFVYTLIESSQYD
ncbi:MAG TPA: tetratricopeptide repeat protein [Usitatibacteraceae bacterium]